MKCQVLTVSITINKYFFILQKSPKCTGIVSELSDTIGFCVINVLTFMDKSEQVCVKDLKIFFNKKKNNCIIITAYLNTNTNTFATGFDLLGHHQTMAATSTYQVIVKLWI